MRDKNTNISPVPRIDAPLVPRNATVPGIELSRNGRSIFFSNETCPARVRCHKSHSVNHFSTTAMEYAYYQRLLHTANFEIPRS